MNPLIIIYNGFFSNTKDSLVVDAEKYFIKNDFRVKKINLFISPQNINSKKILKNIKKVKAAYPKAIHIGHSLSGFFLNLVAQKTKLQTILWDPTDFTKRKANPENFFLYQKEKNTYLIPEINIEINSKFYWELSYKDYRPPKKTKNIFMISPERNNSYYKHITSIQIKSDHNFTRKREELFRKTKKIIEVVYQNKKEV